MDETPEERAGGGSPTRRDLLRLGLLLPVAGCAPARTSARPQRPSASTTDVRPAQTSAATPAHPVAGAAGPSSGPSGRAGLSGPGPAVEVGTGPRSRPQVALTFHGAGDAATARAVLAELQRGDARATVLAVGTWLQEQPLSARRVLDGGHELGNHTLHHLPMRRLSAAEAYAEIDGGAKVLRRLSRSAGHWFRASGTQHTTPIIRRAAWRAGYAQCLSYDVDSLDWTDPGAAAIVRTTLRAVRPGSIVSLHLGHSGTVAALPPLLAGLASRGLHPVTVSELLA